jgi:hypothetical protein
MIQPELNREQIAELEEILEMARITEQKAREMSELSTQIAHKWQQRATARQQVKKQEASVTE